MTVFLIRIETLLEMISIPSRIPLQTISKYRQEKLIFPPGIYIPEPFSPILVVLEKDINNQFKFNKNLNNDEYEKRIIHFIHDSPCICQL